MTCGLVFLLQFCGIYCSSAFTWLLLFNYHYWRWSDIVDYCFTHVWRSLEFISCCFGYHHEIVARYVRVCLIWGRKLLVLIFWARLFQEEWIVLADNDFRVVTRFSLIVAHHTLLFLLELLEYLDRWLLDHNSCLLVYLGLCLSCGLLCGLRLS